MLDHSGVFISVFPRSPFSMLIHTVLVQTSLLSATLKLGGKGEFHFGDECLRQRFHLTIDQKLNSSVVNE